MGRAAVRGAQARTHSTHTRRLLPAHADDAEAVIELQLGLPDGFYMKGFACFALHDYAAAVSFSWCACARGAGAAAMLTHTGRRHTHTPTQAHAFHHGLTLNPADKIMQRGFA